MTVDVPGETAEPAQRPTLPTAVRRDRVLETIRRQQFASVGALSAAFDVSEVTIRSDLDTLAEQGKIQRIRGGAVHRTSPKLEASFEDAQDSHAAEKVAIAAAAANLVESGQTVILDAGTTTAAVARALIERDDLHDVTIFTNSIRVALEVEPAIPRFTVMITGGTLRRPQHSIVNPFGTTILDQIHGHIGILDCEGIDPAAGVTHVNVAEAEIKRLMMKTSRRCVLVADGSKLGQVSLVHLYGVEEVDLLITDNTADAAIIAALRERGVEVRVAG